MLMYRSPVSQRIVTTFLPGPNSWATFCAANTLAPGRDPDEQAFHLRQLFRRLIGFVVRHGDDAVENLPIQDLGNKSGADPLNFVRPRFSA